MWSGVKWVLLLCGVLVAVASCSSSVSYEGIGSGEKGCGLECWLSNLTISLPPQSTVLEGFNLTVSQVVCKKLLLGGITSAFKPPTALALAPYGVGISCTGNWDVEEITWPYLSASGQVEVLVNNSSVALEMHFNKGPLGLAESASMDVCSTHISIASIHFEGGITSKILQLISGVIKDMLTHELEQVICTELSTLINVNLTNALQEIDKAIIPYLHPGPPSPAPPIPPGIVNLLHNPIVKFVGYLVHNLLGPEGFLSLNKLVDRFTHDTGSVFLSENDLHGLTFEVPLSNLGSLTVGVLAINASGLDSWGAFQLFANDNYSLALHTEMDTLEINSTFFVNVTVSGTVSNDWWLYETGDIVIRLAQNNFNATMQLALKEEAIQSTHPDQYIHPGCIERFLYDANLTQLFFNMSVQQLRIIALDGDLEKDLDATIDDILALFTTSFELAIPAFFNGIIAQPVREEVNKEILKFMNQNNPCPDSKPPLPQFNKTFTGLYFGGAGFLSIAVAAILLFVHTRKKEHQSDELLSLVCEELPDAALATHERIPLFVRIGIPLLLLANIALFLSSNTSQGAASVYLVVTLGDQEIQSPALFTFSLTGTVKDMWHAGVYPLALLIAIFSGVWPYLKLLMMLVCWFSPTKFLSTKKRENLLMILDTLGKWSLIDSFVLILMVIAFRFHVAYPTETSAPVISGILDVFVVPEFGFYTFLVATMASLVLSHIMLAFHRSVAEKKPTMQAETREMLCNHTFRVEKSPFSCTLVGNMLVVFLLLLSAGLIIWGSLVDSFAFEFKGAAGFALEGLGEQSETGYSVVSLGIEIPRSSADPNGFGIRFLQATFFLFALTVPLTHIVVLVFLWLLPLTPTIQWRVFTLTEVLNAWSALDVFIVSIIAALLEIQQFTQFMVGSNCDQINVILKKYFTDELDGDPKCFDVVTTLKSGCWILFGACIINIVVGTLVMRICHKAAHEMRDKRALTINETQQQTNGLDCGYLLHFGKSLHLIH